MKEQSASEENTDTAERDEALLRRNNYNRLVRGANLVSLWLRELKFQVTPGALSIVLPEKEALKRDINGKSTVIAYGDDDDDNCIIIVRWNIKIRHKRKTMVRCDASYLVGYSGMTGFDPSLIDVFAETVAGAATYSYFRAAYAQLDWAAELSSPPLPVRQFKARV